jgi:hypothetical protein
MNTVTINNKQLPAVEYRGQRVVTLAMIDEVHQRPEGTAGRNFQKTGLLCRGVDYVELGADAIRTGPSGSCFLNLRLRNCAFRIWLSDVDEAI